jgi:hypothetical protein
MADRPNFRQVGREVGGRVFKGTVSDAYHRTSSSSIPSKYELVLGQQSNAKDAFGTAANRFAPNLSKNPGPGAYSIEDKRTSPSTSTEGYGGLISKSSRFKRFQYASEVPGPGAYIQTKLEAPNRLSHMFVVNARDTAVIKSNAPAVGQYEPRQLTSAKVVTSAFISKSNRFKSAALKTSPAPGQYTPNLTLTRASSAALTSVFMPPSNARRHQVNLYDPHNAVQISSIPGPGEYEAPTAFKSIDAQATLNKSIDSSRFGEQLRPKKTNTDVPGPGHYTLSKPQDKVPVSGAVFMSESERFEFKTVKKPPGPAYYKPAVGPRKRSFHLNAGRQWGV